MPLKGPPNVTRRGKAGGSQGNGDFYDTESTFGDAERKCVRDFKEAYTSFAKVCQSKHPVLQLGCV